MDILVLVLYFAIPAIITLAAYIGLRLHERSAPPR